MIITSAPYAIRLFASQYSSNAQNADSLGGAAANQYIKTNDARLTDARSPTAGKTRFSAQVLAF